MVLIPCNVNHNKRGEMNFQTNVVACTKPYILIFLSGEGRLPLEAEGSKGSTEWPWTGPGACSDQRLYILPTNLHDNRFRRSYIWTNENRQTSMYWCYFQKIEKKAWSIEFLCFWFLFQEVLHTCYWRVNGFKT